MLGSLDSSSHEDEDPSDHHLRIGFPSHGGSPPAQQLRQLLMTCAEHISRSDLQSAARILSLLSSNSSPYGDSTDRLVSQFVAALSLHLRLPLPQQQQQSPRHIPPSLVTPQTVESSFLSLNQITPFIRFSHLTANQAILDALDGHNSVHIVDLNTMQGVQWPPFMQAMAERFPHHGATIRITGTGPDLSNLHRTGARLSRFAQTLGLDFHFHPFLSNSLSDLLLLPQAIASVAQPNEALAVNCVHHLHVHLGHDLPSLLRALKGLNPRVLTLSEREAGHNHPSFTERFSEALSHYSALFESLEATVPPSSRERMAVEQVWFGREITRVLANEEEIGRRERERERHERFERWAEMMRVCGFEGVVLSDFAVSQARLLLRLHYPSEGYNLHLHHDACFLGWQNHPLFSVSSWH
ncbi:hypothetical protein AMTRI_Chr10g233490 [Amborella trichopoda]|uniref:Uncharacterized protein n=1 Tax=Amborella trichopoda TaxID=13333 RepID=U5DC56_AMBTC|nr:scarecrow-like protein 18 [Amborella trichopoda]ERN19012.1 hypothetical protein AMTR_s00061p00045500 [Amborella trichopoda]|eukprot:XP_006857545.1 scarecrow-like protein 18 [Amborella trichopoda]